jgi:hypothetical protein
MCKEDVDLIFHGLEALFAGMLVIVTGVLAVFTYRLVVATQDLFKETKEAAKTQLGVNTWIYFINRWDTPWMIKHRRFNAGKWMKHLGDSDPILDFFEQVGTVYAKDCIDRDLVYSSLSYDAEHWWFAVKDYVAKMREDFDDPKTYEWFEKMVDAIHKAHPDDPPVTQKETEKYMNDEAKNNEPPDMK